MVYVVSDVEAKWSNLTALYSMFLYISTSISVSMTDKKFPDCQLCM